MKNHTAFKLLLLLALLLSACTGKATPAATQSPTATSTATTAPKAVTYDMVTVKMNSSALTSFAPIFIAEAEGYFAEYGIHVEYVKLNKVNNAVPLVASGELDIYAGSVNSGLLNVLAQDNSIKVVADRGHIAPGDPCTYMAIMVRKDLYDSGKITKPSDLAGQTIAASSASTTGYFLDLYLAQAGLGLKDVTLNDIPTAGYVDAFTNKSLAVIVAPELHKTRLLAAGNAVVLAKAEDVLGSTQLSVLVFGKKLLVDHPDVGARFMAAYLKGVKQYNEGKTDRNLQIISAATGESVADLQSSCWLPIRLDGSIDFSGINQYQQWAIAQGQLDGPATEEQFWDPSVLVNAQKLLNP
ncbi:MAG TPA: ABC transporter substrate-binding protein [Anaerolineales bacterium]|nr:ABC transporter substrate-binding protein [Anaerolineales bacterium]